MAESYKMDMLRTQLASVTPNGSKDEDAGSCNSVESVSDLKRQELKSVSQTEGREVVRGSTEGGFDSTESLKLPSPPADSPEAAVADDSGLCSAVSTDVVDSISSRASRDSYVWSLASSDLPWSLPEDEERLIWPSEDQFFAATDSFEENSQYLLSTIEPLGRGAFGKCFLAVEISADNERVFCVKQCEYKINELLALELAKKEKVAEIVDFYGVKIKGKNACIFMELMEGGTIADLIQEMKERRAGKWPVLSETDGLGYLEDVLKAVKFLHSKGIVHRDIKGDNVLLAEDRLRAKLTDFGSAASYQDANPSFDIWKTACLLLEMLNGERPPLLIDEGNLQRQNSCKPEDYIPTNAIQEVKQVLQFCFGLKTTDGNYISAAGVLKYSDAFPVHEFLKRFKPFGEQAPDAENPS